MCMSKYDKQESVMQKETLMESAITEPASVYFDVGAVIARVIDLQ